MAIDVIIGALLGAGIGVGAEALFNQPKSPSASGNAPTLPNQSVASQTATTTVNTSRAALLASGGQTDETGGLGILTGSDVASNSLIGG